MKKNKVSPQPHGRMLKNYQIAKGHMPSDHKSSHWDVFPSDYEKTIQSFDSWKKFLRNPLSLGFNDSLIEFDNARWEKYKTNDSINAWELKKQHDFRELVPEIVDSEKEQKFILNKVKLLFSVCNPEFVIKNLQSDIGSPSKLQFYYKSEEQEKKAKSYFCNAHDLGEIYYFWQISRISDVLINNKSPVILEIGSGYGGMISKIKRRYPEARCILLDLPELSAVQLYYLYNCFPNSKILCLQDILDNGGELFDDYYDFMILPGWMIDRIPPKSVDLLINVRSMMEMKLSIIDYYFSHIHRITKAGGIFANFNRYHKNSSGENIIMKKYPYDDFWSIVISQQSMYQSHIHDLVLLRGGVENMFPISNSLESLPPF